MLEIREGDWLASARRISEFVVTEAADVLLYENFVLRGGGGHSSSAEALDSVRVTSAVIALLSVSGRVSGGWKGEVAPFDTSVKAVMSDVRMKRWGLWLQGKGGSKCAVGFDGGDVWDVKGFEGHATDACRGLVWYCRKGMVL